MSSPVSQGPKKVRTAANAITFAVAAVGAIIVANLVASRVFYRKDLTEDQIFALSSSSKKVVSELPDKLIVKAYISSGLQAPLDTYGKYVRDLLDEYAAASHGKLAWEAIDPLEGTAEEQQKTKDEIKTKYKIQPITLERMSQSKLEIGSDNYLGIAFVYGDKDIQSIPQIASTEGLEYQITSKIKSLIETKKKKVAFANSEGELTPQQGLQIISRFLPDYDTSSLALDKSIPDDIDVLVIAGPKQPFKDPAKHAIDEFLMKGKSVAFFVDGMVIETPQGMMNIPGMDQPKMGRANDVALEDLLGKYGVTVRSDLVLDDQMSVGIVPVGGKMYLANHPVFIKLMKKDGGLSDKLAITDKLRGAVLPFASSVELSGDLKDGKLADVKATELARSSIDSWRQSGFFMFNPQVEPKKTGELGPFPLGYAVEGKIKSAYPSSANASEPGATPSEAPAGTRLLVVGDSDLFADQNLQIAERVGDYQGNLLLFWNAVDWLAHDDTLIALRGKGASARPLDMDDSGKTKFWRLFNVIGLPNLFILFGLVLWRLRRARRRAMQA